MISGKEKENNMNCPCEKQSKEECDICRDIDSANIGNLSILEIANKAYSNAQRLGKVGNNRNAIEKLKDLQGEYMEALMALNDGNHADMPYFYEIMNDNDFSYAFCETLKDTYEQELTDMLFVILTLMKDCGMDIMFHVGAGLDYNKLRDPALKTP